MAENTKINIKLPPQMKEIIGDLQSVRKAQCETHTKTAVVIDAIKQLHRKEVKK